MKSGKNFFTSSCSEIKSKDDIHLKCCKTCCSNSSSATSIGNPASHIGHTYSMQQIKYDLNHEQEQDLGPPLHPYFKVDFLSLNI